MSLFQTFGWRAGSGWVVVQAGTYRLTSVFCRDDEFVGKQGDHPARVLPRTPPVDGERWG